MELHGVEAIVVPILKLLLVVVMLGGGVAVFRELVPMARGRTLPRPEPQEEQS
jgi:hypothetical protein